MHCTAPLGLLEQCGSKAASAGSNSAVEGLKGNADSALSSVRGQKRDNVGEAMATNTQRAGHRLDHTPRGEGASSSSGGTRGCPDSSPHTARVPVTHKAGSLSRDGRLSCSPTWSCGCHLLEATAQNPGVPEATPPATGPMSLA